MQGFAKALALELGTFGATVHAIAPGFTECFIECFIETGMTAPGSPLDGGPVHPREC